MPSPWKLIERASWRSGSTRPLQVTPSPNRDSWRSRSKTAPGWASAAPRSTKGLCEATARFGQAVRFQLSELVSVHVRSPRLVYLTERKPVEARYIPYVGPTREIRADRTIDGHLFQLSGQTFDRGIGAQSRTLLAYRLEAGDRRFQALVGVDERAGPLGSVVFRVLVDGQERFKSPPLDRSRPAQVDRPGCRGWKVFDPRHRIRRSRKCPRSRRLGRSSLDPLTVSRARAATICSS